MLEVKRGLACGFCRCPMNKFPVYYAPDSRKLYDTFDCADSGEEYNSIDKLQEVNKETMALLEKQGLLEEIIKTQGIVSIVDSD